MSPGYHSALYPAFAAIPRRCNGNNFAPFLGLTWDPWSNGKTKFAATFRRYYDKIFLSVPLIELEPVTTDVQWNGTPLANGMAMSFLPAE